MVEANGAVAEAAEEAGRTADNSSQSKARSKEDAVAAAAAKAAALQARNQSYVQKMLSLPKLVFTEQMLRFMLQEGVAQILVSFITQVDKDSSGEPVERPVRGGPLTEELKKSYRAAMLLAGPEPTEALGVFVESRAPLLFTSLFDIFSERSRGSYAHACHVLDCLIEYDVDMCLEVLSESREHMERLVGAMLSAMEHAPVASTLLKLLRSDEASARQKWDFYARLKQYDFFRRVACCLSGDVERFQDLVDKNSNSSKKEWFVDAPAERREACAELLHASWEFMIEEDVFAAELLLKPSIEDIVKSLAIASTTKISSCSDDIVSGSGSAPRSSSIIALNELVKRAGAVEVEGDVPLSEDPHQDDDEHVNNLEGKDENGEDRALLVGLFEKIAVLLEAGELEAWVVRMDRRRREVAVTVHRILSPYVHTFSEALVVEERTVRVEVDIDVRSPLGIGLTNSATIGHLKANTQFNVRAPELAELETIPKLVEELAASVQEQLATDTKSEAKESLSNNKSEDDSSDSFSPIVGEEGVETNGAKGSPQGASRKRTGSGDARLSPKEGDVDEESEDDVAVEVDAAAATAADAASETGATANATNTSYKRLALHAVVPGSRIVSVRPKEDSSEITPDNVTNTLENKEGEIESKSLTKVTSVDSLAELSGALQKCRDEGVNQAVLELDVPTAGMSPAQILYSEDPSVISQCNEDSFQMSLLDKVGLVCLLADMATVHPDHFDLFPASPPSVTKKPEEGEVQICPWYRLNALFFAHPKSDMLSNAYFRLFEAAVRNNHTASLRYLFVGDACFFGRLVAPLTRHPDEFTHPIDAPQELLSSEVKSPSSVTSLNGDTHDSIGEDSSHKRGPVGSKSSSETSVSNGDDAVQRERNGSEDSIMSSVSNFSSYSASANVICLPTAAPGLPISQALRFCQVLRECCDEHPDTSILSSTLRKHALWSSEVLPRLGVLEGAWNDHGMGIHVERGDDADSDSYSDEEEHVAVESIGEEEGGQVVQSQFDNQEEKQQAENPENRSDSNKEGEIVERKKQDHSTVDDSSESSEEEEEEAAALEEASSVIHVVEVRRLVMSPLLELTNGKFEVVNTVKTSSLIDPCVNFIPATRKWKHTKRIKYPPHASTSSSPSQVSELPTSSNNTKDKVEVGVMTREEEEWCAQQKLKDEENLAKKRLADKASEVELSVSKIVVQTKETEDSSDTSPNEMKDLPSISMSSYTTLDDTASHEEEHVMESALNDLDAQVEAHVEAENIFFAPFMGSPEIAHRIQVEASEMDDAQTTPNKKYKRRASEIRPLTVISPDRLKPSIRREDGKVSGRMSPIKAPKRSPKSPLSPSV